TSRSAAKDARRSALPDRLAPLVLLASGSRPSPPAQTAAKKRRCPSSRPRGAPCSAKSASSPGSSPGLAACRPPRHLASTSGRRARPRLCRSRCARGIETRGGSAGAGNCRKAKADAKLHTRFTWSVSMQIDQRAVGDVVVLDLKGKITLREGDELLKDKVNSLVNQGHRKIVLNLADVPYIDSAGLGEIVRTYTTVSRQGGSLKLLNLTKRITDLLSITKLLTVFETFDTESEAVRSFSAAKV